MEPTFGARLRAQRERQQVDLTAIAAQTKIKVTLLEALESDDVANWPRGIFGRAYLRDYLRAIGFDPEPLVREFYAMHPDPVGPVPAHPDPEQVEIEMAAATPLRRLVSAFASFPSLLQRPRAPQLVPNHAGAGTMMMDGVADERFAAVDAALEQADDAGYAAAEQPRATSDDEPARTSPRPSIAPRPDAGAAPARVGAPANSASPNSASLNSASPNSVAPAAADAAPVASAPLAAPAIQKPTSGTVSSDVVVRLSAVASLCTRLAQAVEWGEVEAVLADAARLLDAPGLIVWAFDARSNSLRPLIAHGYPRAMLSRMPAVDAHESNALAASFRSAEPATVEGDEQGNGAVVVPLLTPRGPVGVFSAELRNGGERRESLRALAMILSAQVATLVDVQAMPHAASA